MTKRQRELITDAVLSNLHDMVNQGARDEIARLKKKIKLQDRIIRKAQYTFSTIKCDIDLRAREIEAMSDDDSPTARKAETPNLAAKQERDSRLRPR